MATKSSTLTRQQRSRKTKRKLRTAEPLSDICWRPPTRHLEPGSNNQLTSWNRTWAPSPPLIIPSTRCCLASTSTSATSSEATSAASPSRLCYLHPIDTAAAVVCPSVCVFLCLCACLLFLLSLQHFLSAAAASPAAKPLLFCVFLRHLLSLLAPSLSLSLSSSSSAQTTAFKVHVSVCFSPPSAVCRRRVHASKQALKVKLIRNRACSLLADWLAGWLTHV